MKLLIYQNDPEDPIKSMKAMEEEKKKGKEKQQRNVSIENTFVTVSSSFECKMCTTKTQ